MDDEGVRALISLAGTLERVADAFERQLVLTEEIASYWRAITAREQAQTDAANAQRRLAERQAEWLAVVARGRLDARVRHEAAREMSGQTYIIRDAKTLRAKRSVWVSDGDVLALLANEEAVPQSDLMGGFRIEGNRIGGIGAYMFRTNDPVRQHVCSCSNAPWCVPHGWAGNVYDDGHRNICADHEHVEPAGDPTAEDAAKPIAAVRPADCVECRDLSTMVDLAMRLGRPKDGETRRDLRYDDIRIALNDRWYRHSSERHYR